MASPFVTNTLAKMRYAGFVGVKLCTELPTVFSDEGGGRSRLGVDPGEACCQRTVGKPPAKPLENCRETTGKTAGKPPGNRRRTAGKPPVKPLENRQQNRWKTGVEPLESRRENCRANRPETVGKSPVFGSLLPVSIRDRNGLEGPLRRHFSGSGGGCHRGVLPRLNSCTFPSDGVGGTGICGFLSVR